MAEADQVAGNPAVYRSGQEIECWLTDMDGVLVHENQPIPGAAELIQRWVDTSKRFLVLTGRKHLDLCPCHGPVPEGPGVRRRC